MRHAVLIDSRLITEQTPHGEKLTWHTTGNPLTLVLSGLFIVGILILLSWCMTFTANAAGADYTLAPIAHTGSPLGHAGLLLLLLILFNAALHTLLPIIQSLQPAMLLLGARQFIYRPPVSPYRFGLSHALSLFSSHCRTHIVAKQAIGTVAFCANGGGRIVTVDIDGRRIEVGACLDQAEKEWLYHRIKAWHLRPSNH